MKKGLFILVDKKSYIDIRFIPRFLDYVTPIYSKSHIHVVHTKRQLEEKSKYYEIIDLINYDVALGYISKRIGKYILSSSIEYSILAILRWIINPRRLSVIEKLSIASGYSFKEFLNHIYSYIPLIID